MKSQFYSPTERSRLFLSPRRAGMSANMALLAAILWSAAVIAGAFLWKHQTAAEDENSSADAIEISESADKSSDDDSAEPKSLTIRFPPRPVPDFELDECMGERFGLEDLKRKRWVASFVFTRCAATCPTITLAMKKLHDRVVKDNSDVMFVTMTVDSKYDTAEILQRYSETYSPDRERWKFITGDMDAMHELIVKGFGIYVEENLGDDRRAGFEVAHSNRVVLVNEDGIPVGTWLGTVDSDMADLAKVLTGRKPFPEPSSDLEVTNEDGRPAEGIQLQAVPAKSDEEATSKEQSGDDDDVSAMTVSQRLSRMDRLLPDWAKRLPTVNALLNSTSTLLLSFGWLAIKSGHRIAHRNAMITAFVVSVVFLLCYLTSHWALSRYTGERGRPFSGSAAAARAYYIILVPHILLAATVPFLAVRVFQHAFAERWDEHRRLARITFPVWMYVSVTGVIIYGMLYHWPSM